MTNVVELIRRALHNNLSPHNSLITILHGLARHSRGCKAITTNINTTRERDMHTCIYIIIIKQQICGARNWRPKALGCIHCNISYYRYCLGSEQFWISQNELKRCRHESRLIVITRVLLAERLANEAIAVFVHGVEAHLDTAGHAGVVEADFPWGTVSVCGAGRVEAHAILAYAPSRAIGIRVAGACEGAVLGAVAEGLSWFAGVVAAAGAYEGVHGEVAGHLVPNRFDADGGGLVEILRDLVRAAVAAVLPVEAGATFGNAA